MRTSTRAGLAGTLALTTLAAVLTASVAGAHADTEPVAAPLPAPSIVGPDDSTGSYPYPVLKTVTLDWAPVSGATGYRVQVGTDSTWSSAPDYTTDVLYSQATLPISLPNATYFWRVAALDGSTLGHWSSETGQLHSDATFVKGWRQAPALNTVTSPFFALPSFSWSPVPEASGYEVQVSADPTFGQQGTATSPSPDTTPSPGTDTQATPQPAPLFADCLTARTRYTPSQEVVGKEDSVGPCNFNAPPPATTTVFWRVRALDAYVDASSAGSTAPVASEGVSYQGPAAASSTPPDLTSGCPQPPSSGSASASPSPSPSASASAAPTTLTLTCDPTRPSVKGSWSAVQSFTWDPTATATAGPAQIVTDSLANEDDGLCAITNSGTGEAEHAQCTDVPTLHWQPVSGATEYRVVIALDDAFSNIQYEMETPALQWSPTGSWRDGLYYYAVQPCTDTACGPVTTTPPSFSKLTPRLTGLSTPPVRSEFSLSWQPYRQVLQAASGKPETQDAYAYRVQVATADHPSYDTVVDDEVVDQSFLTPRKNYGDGSFVYRVQPIDSKGNALPWSVSKSFVRDATPPRVVSVSPMTSVAVTQPLRITFSEPVVGVSSSTVTLSPAVATTVVVTSSTTATITPVSHFVPGQTYVIHVAPSVTDLVGNPAIGVGPSVTVSPFVDDPSRAIAYSGTWRAYAASNAIGGTYHGALPTSTTHPAAALVFFGTGVTLTSCLGPSNGYLDVYLDGVRKARVSLYRSYTGCDVRILTVYSATRGTHTVRVVGVGAHVSASRGNAVALDALTAIH